MPLTSSIVPYDARWPERYAEEAARLTPTFGVALIEIHHVGSTSVAELSAKPEIDILVIVNDVNIPEACTGALQRLGYRRGEELSPGHHYYRHDVAGVRTHKVHVCLEGHPTIDEMLRFRDHLRTDGKIRLQYQALKLKLEKENTGGIGEYLAGKAPFINTVLSAIDQIRHSKL